MRKLPKWYKRAVLKIKPEPAGISQLPDVSEFSQYTRFPQLLDAISKISKKMKKKEILVNDVGVGINDSISVKARDIQLVTFEPYQIADKVLSAGKKPNIFGYSLRGAVVDELNRKILPYEMENLPADRKNEILKSVKFGKLNLINATPSRRADISVCMTVLGYIHNKQPNSPTKIHHYFPRRAALINLAGSTRKGGYIILDQKYRKEDMQRFGLVDISPPEPPPEFNFYVYKKVK